MRRQAYVKRCKTPTCHQLLVEYDGGDVQAEMPDYCPRCLERIARQARYDERPGKVN